MSISAFRPGVVFFLAASLASFAMSAAMLPEQFSGAARTQSGSADTYDPLWREFGLKTSEQATYEAGKRHLRASVYQFGDTTGAFAAWEWQRGQNGHPSSLSPAAWASADRFAALSGPFLIVIEGATPSAADWKALTGALPALHGAPLPTLNSYLSAAGRIPGTERHLLGPASASQFAGSLPAAETRFDLGAEGAVAAYRTREGTAYEAVFSYPTMSIARDRFLALQKLPGLTVHRSGPLVGAVWGSATPAEASKLLASLEWRALVTSHKSPPSPKENPGNLLINVALLIGILLVFFVVSGLLFGGLRYLFRRQGDGPGGESFISLGL